MPSCNQVVTSVKEQVVSKPTSRGFFRRIAEKVGLVQKEVAECKGKSLSEMAEMTSKKDVVVIDAKTAERIKAIKEYRTKMENRVRELEEYIPEREAKLKKLEDEYIKDVQQYNEAYQRGPIKVPIMPDSDTKCTMARESYDAFKARLKGLQDKIKLSLERYESAYTSVEDSKKELLVRKEQVANAQERLLEYGIHN